MGHAARLVLLVPAVAHADVEVRTAVEAGLHAPRSLAVDIWGKLSERLIVGLTTSHDAQHALGVGRGLCVSRCGDRLVTSLPDDDSYRYAGLAAEARLLFGDGVTGRVALDTTRFVPTPAAIDLGLDLARRYGATTLTLEPQLRIGIARRDLDDNRDSLATTLEVAHAAWPCGGVSAIARGALDVQALRSTPSFGAAVGAWQTFGAWTLSVRVGTFELARESARSSLFTEIAVAWRR